MFEKSFEIEFGFDDPDGYEGNGKGRKVVTETTVRNGLYTMSRDYPKHFAKVMSGDGDADTADAFVQCIVFGKVPYG